MPRPKSKPELLSLSKDNFQKLFELIEGLEVDEQHKEFPVGTMNRNIRDVLAHLHHWHLMLMDWYTVGMSGAKPEMPAKGYTWKMTPELNKWIWRNYQKSALDAIKQMLKDSHQKIQAIIEEHSNEELFEKKRYKWTGTTSLGAYLISSTSSHYAWALKTIKKARKN